VTSLDDLTPAARDLAEASTEAMDGWWDADAGLLWNPPGSLDAGVEARSLHLVPQSGWYALGLLLRRRPGDVERAVATLRAVVACQYDEPGTVWHGTYARFGEWPRPGVGAVEWVDYDPNWREFAGTTFALVLHRLGQDLPPEVVSLLEDSIALAQRGEPEGRISPRYSNIALMKAWLDADTGARSADPDLVAVGEAFAAEVVDGFRRHGTFEEYGSPTYYGVDLYALALWRDLPPTPRFAEWAAEVEAALWRDVARWYHAGLKNLCGPYTRSYGMDMRRSIGLLGLWLWPVLGREAAPVPDLGRPFGHSHDLSMGPVAALLGPAVPTEVRPHLESFSGERQVRQVIADDPHRVATGWLADDVMAGGETNAAGWSARGQYHPATVHWRLPDGGVGTIRVVHVGPVDAEASAGRLRLRCGDHRRAGPQSTTFVLDVGGAGPEALDVTPARWALPGLTVEVSGPTAGVSLGPEGTVWPPGEVTLELHLRPER
jgi:hypothetical protein